MLHPARGAFRALLASGRSFLRHPLSVALSTAKSAATAAAPAAMQKSSTDEVRCRTTPQGLGTITLMRDRQLNALGAEHVEALRQQLLAWAQPGSCVQCVLLESNSERSFCSGEFVSNTLI